MRTLYLDAFAGIAGDMMIGALLDLMPDTKVLLSGLQKLTKLPKSDYELEIERGVKNGISGINFDVRTEDAEEGIARKQEHHHHHHRHLSDIEELITSSELPSRVKVESLRAFNLLAEAEASVHGTTPDEVHFHEVGAVDAIIDIVGTFILLDALNWPRVLSSRINVGSGTVKCAHGILPVPAPATAKLLQGLPIYSFGSPMERTTPTGAVLVKLLCDGFSTIPSGKIIASGYGLGNRDSEDMPNVLRVLLLETETESAGLIHERVSVIATNIDDMQPQDYEVAINQLYCSGALDVWTEPLGMKKSRCGVKLCCLCPPDKTHELSRLIMTQTTTQGVRYTELDRLRLKWQIEEVSTSLGVIHVKSTELDGHPLRRIPEYEDVKRLSLQHQKSMHEIRQTLAKEI